eukprot:5031068-Lingulodinium_polyedra.AAC.1
MVGRSRIARRQSARLPLPPGLGLALASPFGRPLRVLGTIGGSVSTVARHAAMAAALGALAVNTAALIPVVAVVRRSGCW